MAMDLSSILGSAALVSGQTSSIDNLVNMYMSVEKQPLTTLKTQRDQLDVKAGMFKDLKAKIDALKSAADGLATKVSIDSAFNAHTTVSSDNTYASATASTSAANGTYLLDNIVLATAQRLQSSQLASSWTAGGAGSFVLNGALINVTNGMTLSSLRDAINAASYAAGKGVAATIVNQDATRSRLILDAQSTGTANAIQLADVAGATLSDLGIATTAPATPLAGVTATADSSDPAFPPANLTDGVTGDANSWHGLAGASSWTVTFDLGGSQSVDRMEWGRDQGGVATDGTPKNYTLQYSSDGGTTWNTVTTASNNSLAIGATKEETFFPVTANKLRMVISATNDGTAPAIDEVKLYNDAGSVQGGSQLQAAGDASLTVNTVPVSGLASNRNITGAVSGLTLQLNKAGGPVTLTVGGDTNAMTTRINTFLNALNSLNDYIATKSAVTQGANNTYTRGLLSGQTLYTNLKASLASDLATQVAGLPMGAPTQLADLGITLDSSLHFSVTDSSKLNNWLTSNPSGVAALFGGDSGIAKLVSNRLSPYDMTATETNKSYIDRELDTIDAQQKSIDTRTTALNERLAIREQSLREQFTKLQALMIQAVQQQQQISSIFAGY